MIIPGDHVFSSICAGEAESIHHGARIHLLSGEHAKRTLETCKMLVTDNALLGQMKTGALLQALEAFCQKASAVTGSQPASEQTTRAAKRPQKNEKQTTLVVQPKAKAKASEVEDLS